MADALTDEELVGVLQRYLTVLQGHPPAEKMMEETLTDDYETGFIGGQVWKGIEGMRDFLSQRDGFFDEKHTIEELLGRGQTDEDVTAEMVERFDDLNENSKQLFATPDEGLNR
jgi:hypothetical protein